MRQQLLLLEDVDNLGRSGELVTVKAGYARNFLFPQRKGVAADKNTLRMQQKLQNEREKRAKIDRKESEEIAAKVENITLKKEVKIDPDGHMYGSVTVNDIYGMLQEEGVTLDKSAIKVLRPIKETGSHTILLKLKEGLEVNLTLKIIPEGMIEAEVDEVVVKAVEPEASMEPTEDMLEPIKSEQEPSEKEKKEINEASKKI